VKITRSHSQCLLGQVADPVGRWDAGHTRLAAGASLSAAAGNGQQGVQLLLLLLWSIHVAVDGLVAETRASGMIQSQTARDLLR
jgi:hypothetical protein